MRTLRPYQQAALDATRQQLKQFNSTVVVLPTGLGKTVYAAKLIAQWEQGNTLFLAHTKELINQAADKLGVELGYRPGVEMGTRAVEFGSLWQGGLTIVGSVQSMYGDKRLEKYNNFPFGLIVVDECVTGDTLIETDCGKIAISQIPICRPRSVMTYNGEEVCYRPITAFVPKGNRPVLRIETQSGKVIRCTGNHPIYTATGWKRADEIHWGERLLSADADAGKASAGTGGGDNSGTSSGTRTVAGREPVKSGSRSTTSYAQPPLFARAVAASVFNSVRGRWKASSASIRATGATRVSPTATTGDLTNGRMNLRPTSGKRFSERSWVIAALGIRTPAASTPVCTSTTAARNGSGLDTRHHSLPPSRLARTKARALGTVPSPSRFTRDASPVCARFTTSPTAPERSGLVVNGLMPSAASALRGGSVTMARHPATPSTCTPKATPKMMCGSRPIGSATTSDPRASTNEVTTSCLPHSRPRDVPSSAPSNSTSPRACSTSFDPVVSVRSDGVEPVYDISVEGTHCFFGNGVLVHNCHHSTSATYKKVVSHFQTLNPNLKVVGITATPNRSDGTALGLMFESVAYQMSINDAVTDGWLVPVNQEYVVVDSLSLDDVKTKKNEFGEADFAQGQLEEVMIQEEMLHKLAVPTLDKVGDRPTLIFTASVRHAHELAAVLNRYRENCAVAVDGTTQTERRQDIIRDFSEGKVQFLCNCAVLTEGFDAPKCAAVVMGRPTKSLTLYTQMLGRGLRPLSGIVDGVPDSGERRLAILTSDKPSCTVLDFVGNSNHKLANAYDVLGGNYDSETRELARREAAKERKDVGEVMEQAAALLTLERKWKEREHIKARDVVYGSHAVNPFDEFGAEIVGSDYTGPSRGTATDSQVRLLVNFGVSQPVAERCSKRQAGAMIDSIGKTRCTSKQAATLKRAGINPEGIPFARASRIIDALVKNNWQRPEVLPE